MSKGKKCTPRECRRFERSQAAHFRSAGYWDKKGNSDVNRAYYNYHADMMDRQNRAGKVLSKSERRKIFSWWWNYETKH